MKIFLIIVIGLLVSFYLFFYILGLIIINKTKKIAKESGWTEEKEYEHQKIMKEWQEQEEKAKQEAFRQSIIEDVAAEDSERYY